VFVQKLIEHSSNGLLCVDDCCEVERDSDVDVSRCSCIFLLKNNLGLVKFEVLYVDEFRVQIRNGGARAHFEEAVEDDDE
jgi:hypothetical protein